MMDVHRDRVIRSDKVNFPAARIAAAVALPLAIALPAGATVNELEHVTVRAQATRAPWGNQDNLLTRPIAPTDAPAPPRSIADLAQQQPSIAYAGQGGLLQTLSVRGLSGQQVANFWGDIPILGDRRAGTASSFIDPVMLGSLEILRGPASTFYGNGAGAGVLQLAPHRPEGLEWQLQWGTGGNENLQYLGAGSDAWSLAVSRRSADDDDTPQGDRLHSRYDQFNLQTLGEVVLGARSFRLQQLFSEGRDIGKSNADFPERITDYPLERHWLGQISGEIADSLEGSVFYHYQELETRVEQAGTRINDVNSESFDYGIRLTHRTFVRRTDLRLGVEYLGRRNVESRERETVLPAGALFFRQNLDGEQDSLDLFADTDYQVGPLSLGAGLRWSWLEQRNAGVNKIDDSAWSGFARAAWTPHEQWLVTLELASGVRFAGVSERFFSGTTGRSRVLANPALDPEETRGIDFGLQWRGERAALEVHLFGLRIDDYIERVDIAPDLRSFRNLTEGEITGAEAALTLRWRDAWTLELGGHYLDAEDDAGTPLASAVAPSLFAALHGSHGQWQTGLRLAYRFSESDVAPGEFSLDSARTLDASLSRRWDSGFELAFWGRNLLDDTWRLSSDRLATDAPEFSAGVSLSWRQSVR